MTSKTLLNKLLNGITVSLRTKKKTEQKTKQKKNKKNAHEPKRDRHRERYAGISIQCLKYARNPLLYVMARHDWIFVTRHNSVMTLYVMTRHVTLHLWKRNKKVKKKLSTVSFETGHRGISRRSSLGRGGGRSAVLCSAKETRNGTVSGDNQNARAHNSASVQSFCCFNRFCCLNLCWCRLAIAVFLLCAAGALAVEHRAGIHNRMEPVLCHQIDFNQVELHTDLRRRRWVRKHKLSVRRYHYCLQRTS